VSRRREVQQRQQGLGEIREIMNSMKTLAYLETRKLGRFLAAQTAVVSNIEQAAADFLAFHPDILPTATETTPVYLLIGSERGLCADFNHALLRELERLLGTASPAPLLLPVGHKLDALLTGDARVAATVNGASVVDEVAAALEQLIRELAGLQQRRGPLTLRGLYHCAEGDIVMRNLLPPLRHLVGREPQFPDPPQLTLPPRQFLLDLADHYLFAALHEMLYASLMAENQLRVSHLEGAVQHLDSESAELARRSNALRQEEIIEEIEVILLSAVDLAQGGSGRPRSGA
jgi:F-type H+-transporting ATPase subunit gamma